MARKQKASKDPLAELRASMIKRQEVRNAIMEAQFLKNAPEGHPFTRESGSQNAKTR